MDLPSEILTLAKASPWALAAWLVFRLLSPFASILSIRLARNDKERAAFLEHRRIERRAAIRLPWQKRDEGSKDE